jgi:hypothetical protein
LRYVQADPDIHVNKKTLIINYLFFYSLDDQILINEN